MSESHERLNDDDKTDGRTESQQQREKSKVGLRERLKHVTWAWFTAVMSTGGLAIALAETPHRFRGLYTIGVIIYLFSIVLFVTLCVCMVLRLIIAPQHFKRSFVHPSEAFFFGSFWLGLCTILGGTQLYGVTYGPCGEWLTTTLRILYYIYATLTLLSSLTQYTLHILSRNTPSSSSQTPTPTPTPILFNPSWFLPGYSAMLTGTLATLLAPTQPPHHKLPILVSGLAFQGYGWCLSSILLVFFLWSLMERGFPPAKLRPGLFITVGTTAYTIVVFIGLARAIPEGEGAGWWEVHPGAREVLRTFALFVGVFLWLFSFWLFAVALVGCVLGVVQGTTRNGSNGNNDSNDDDDDDKGKNKTKRKRDWGFPFALPWWAFIFPNVGFTLATVAIGHEFESEAILWVGSVMTGLLAAVWLGTFGACVRAVVRGEIVWPGKDEDVGMFKDE